MREKDWFERKGYSTGLKKTVGRRRLSINPEGNVKRLPVIFHSIGQEGTGWTRHLRPKGKSSGKEKREGERSERNPLGPRTKGIYTEASSVEGVSLNTCLRP